MEKKLKRKTIYKGRIITLAVDRVKTKSRTSSREFIKHPGSSVILPVINKDPVQILLIRQYRYAAGEYLYELPAGTRDPNESALQCARRELKEETGFKAGRMKKIISFYPSPGISTEFMDVFCAYGLTPSAAQKDPDEIITTKKISLQDALSMIKTGRIKDAKTTASILYFKLSRENRK
ncbi:MAG: NUDIX hydrolase [Candidatus Goldiibacteriota bacterium]